jgi:predicted dehydrogenase
MDEMSNAVTYMKKPIMKMTALLALQHKNYLIIGKGEKQMDKVKIGVVGMIRGAGVIAEVVGHKDVEVTAICDNNPKVLAAAAERLEKAGAENVACYEDYDKMLAEADIDAVYVVTYATAHVPFVLKALEAGKHVLSEIPTVATLEESKVLKAAVLAHPELKYMTAENCCYWGFIQAWKKMFEAGKFGKAVYAESEYVHTLKPEEI